ncbi:undecaprenyl-diphosphate phosphatase [Patescibacteria group bacterium]|jgi:undecaprenyl-diphosphatase|nr:undecaprenyl-diphosphate phosphatase [Patescibacteria group bacterium]
MWFDALQGLVLGAIQGLTEFFPVSSSGHLILVPVLLHWPDQGLGFDTVLHLGTLAALLWFFRDELGSLFLRIWTRDLDGRAARMFVAKLAVATIPAVLVALALGDIIETSFRDGRLVAFNLALWGLVLLWADRSAKNRHTDDQSVEHVTWKQAIVVGVAQPLALIPGTSRSGITISAGLFSGLSRPSAARFSFFLSIPITAAAGLSGIMKVMKHGMGADGMLSLVVGFAAALLFGLFAIRFLLSYVAKRRYDGFVAYRLALALLIAVLV